MLIPGGGTAGCGGAGVEVLDVGGGAAGPGAGAAGWGGEAEVAGDLGDDVGDGAGGEVPVEVGVVQAVPQFGAEALGAVAFVCGAVDGVLDGTQDVLAGGGAVVGWVAGGRGRVGQALGKGDAAADGAADAVEGVGQGDEGGGRRLVGHGRGGRRRDGSACCFGLVVGLRVQEASEAGTHADEVVQDGAVAVRVRWGLGGIVLRRGVGWVG